MFTTKTVFSAKTIKSALIVLSLAGLTAAISTEAFARGGGGGGRGGGFRGGGGGGFRGGGFRSGGFRGGHFGGFRSSGFRGGHFGGFRGRVGGHFGHNHFGHHRFGWNRFGWNRGWNRGWGWNRYSWNYGYRRPWYPTYSYQPSYPAYAPAYVLPAAVYSPAPAYTPPPPPPAAIPNPTYLTIQFQQGVSAADVTGFLTSYNVKLADGPTQDGTYRVLVHQGPVPQDQLNQLVDSMRGQTNIVAQVAA